MDMDFGGWASSDKAVCWRCVSNDDYLIATIRSAGKEGSECSYCGGGGAAALDVLLELVDSVAEAGWEDADSYPGVYSSADGGYQFPTSDLWDVQQDFLGDYIEDGNLLEDILGSFEPRLLAQSWGPEDVYGGTAWEGFSRFVMHRARYMFWTDSESLSSEDYHWYGGSPIRALEDLAQRIQDQSLVRTLDKTTGLWRAQGHRGPTIDGGACGARLGTVPEEFAFAPNRMSAPGIPMFYGSLDQPTAVTETTRHGDPQWDHATVGRFTPTRDIVCLDLTLVTVPDSPSVFRQHDDPVVTAYNEAQFLGDFVDTVRRPVSDDPARRGIDYVPTQVFTEFVLHALGRMADPEQRIDGIIYPSAEIKGSANIVLDVQNSQCVDTPSQFALEGNRLELVLDADSVDVASRSWELGPRDGQP